MPTLFDPWSRSWKKKVKGTPLITLSEGVTSEESNLLGEMIHNLQS